MSKPPPASTGRLPPLDIDTLDQDRRAMIDQVMGGRGRLPTPYRLWIYSPDLARHLHPLSAFLSSGTSLSKREAEIAVLAASHHWRTGYVFTAHAREAREAGLDEAVITAIADGRAPEPADPRERAIADLLTALTGSAEPPAQAVFDAAVEAVGHGGIAELLMLAGYFTAVGLAMKTYAVVPPVV